MQKVDMVIAAVGAVALIATVTGVVLYKEGYIEEPPITYGSFEDSESLVRQATGKPAGAVDFNDIKVQDNATGADVMVVVTFTGQPLEGSTIEVSGYWTDPTGVDHDFQTQNIVVPRRDPQAASPPTPSAEFHLAADWAEAPATGEEVEAMVWDDIQIHMTIGGDSENAGGVPLPGVQPVYTYTVDVSGTITGFRVTTPISDVGGP